MIAIGAIIWSIALCPFPWSLIASYQQDPPSSLITSLLLFHTDLFLPFSAVINRDFCYFFPDIQKLLDMQWDNHDASTVIQRDNGPSGITSSRCLQLNFFSPSINLLCMCVLRICIFKALLEKAFFFLFKQTTGQWNSFALCSCDLLISHRMGIISLPWWALFLQFVEKIIVTVLPFLLLWLLAVEQWKMMHSISRCNSRYKSSFQCIRAALKVICFILLCWHM